MLPPLSHRYWSKLPSSHAGKNVIVLLLDILLCMQSIWIVYSLRIGVWVLWDIAIQKIVLACLFLMIPIFAQ
tara:strand:- start:166 stop:381 length:216 start_codon:yes stop_codon:yes gene_type:complete